MDKKESSIKIIVMISYIIMILINILSFILPFDGRNIAEIAASYPNLFTPSSYAYYIWILVYLLMGVFAVYQLDLSGRNHIQMKLEALYYAQIVFIALCCLDIIWVFAWLYDYIALSAVIIFIMVLCIRYICKLLRNMDLSRQGKIYIKLPFSVLFGWFTISTAMIIVILFVSIGWEGFQIPFPVWASATLIGMAVYASIRTQRNKDIAYCITIIWGYIGVLIKHVSKNELSGQYPQMIIAIILCITLMAGSALYLILFKKKKIH